MKKNALKLKIAIVCIATFTLVFASCKKIEKLNPIIALPETGSYTASINGNAIIGNIYALGNNMANNEFYNKPTLEVFLNGENSQIAFTLINPTVGTPIKCGVNNTENFANFVIQEGSTAKYYTSGENGNITVTLTELDATKAVGTFSGTAIDAESISATPINITNGSFTINF